MKVLWTMICALFLLINVNVAGSTQEVSEVKKPKIAKTDGTVEFLNEKGRVMKELSLKPEKEVQRENIDISEGNKIIKKQVKVKKHVSKDATLSNDKKRLAHTVNRSESGYTDEKGKEHVYTEWKWATGEVAYLDESGNNLWVKQFPRYHAVEKVAIADNNTKIAVIVSCYEKDSLQPREPYATLHVINDMGNEDFIWPSDNTKYTKVMSDNPIFSPNGRYLGLLAENINHRKTAVFIDLVKKATWDAMANYVIYGISNDGLAHVGSMDASGQEKSIDLKTHFGD